MSPDQRKVLGGMAGGAVAAAALLALGWWLGPAVGARLTWSRIIALGLILLALPLAASVARVASRRFFGPGIDGGAPAGEVDLDLDRRILTNTLEQTALATLAFMALIIALPGRAAGGALIYAAGFVLARAAFAIGYRRSGVARAFGFAATFYPTVLALAVALVMAFAR